MGYTIVHSNGADTEVKDLRKMLDAAEHKITQKNEVLSELMEEHVHALRWQGETQNHSYALRAQG